ncbi:MAG: chromosome segregation protein SMC [Gammaproteobacteria bacterium]|nr:chromosome segregation protein SMC [Gammaproteobacteria bacterium]
MREVRLRPGLNILWAPDPAERGDQVGGDAGFIGHGSGKTLFCRLLRYCLGEDRFAADEQREGITHAFPKGIVGAEVVVDGVPWVVVRPIGMGWGHLAVRDGNLDEVVNGNQGVEGVEPFLDAIAETFRFEELAAVVPQDRPRDTWRLALAWLSRDQECRFDKLLDWRSADSQSGSAARSLSVPQLRDTLRALIGAIDPAEYALREEIARLEAEHAGAKQEAGRRVSEARRLQSSLSDELQLDPECLVPGPMAVEVLREAATARLDRLGEVEDGSDAAVTDLGALRSESYAARQRVEELQNRLSGVQARIPEIEALVARIRGEIPGASARARGAEHPVCPVCEVPVDLALADGCKLSHQLPDLEEMKRRLGQLQQDAERERQRLEQHREQERRIMLDLNPARERADKLHRRLRSTELMRDTRSEAWFRARRCVEDVERLDRLLAEHESVQSRADALQGEIESRRDRAGAFRDAQAGVFDVLSRTFDRIIRTVVGMNASGRVALEGKGLRASVVLGGERSTAAIDSLKVIAFDLAVMQMSVEGLTHLPAFLIHDSPREADLGLGVYHRLFHFVRDLEDGGDGASFQYIVTTTTSPPSALRMDPWLVETLGGAAEDRLLRRDL